MGGEEEYIQNNTGKKKKKEWHQWAKTLRNFQDIKIQQNEMEDCLRKNKIKTEEREDFSEGRNNPWETPNSRETSKRES